MIRVLYKNLLHDRARMLLSILAVGAVTKAPVVAGDEITVGHRMRVTLSSDHRVVDGALAAQFLQEVRRLLENPVTLFV